MSKRGTNERGSRTITPPAPVEILRGSTTGYWKKGQFGYALVANNVGGSHVVDRSYPDSVSKPGETVYLVSKSKDMRGGALWFSAEALRFTSR